MAATTPIELNGARFIDPNNRPVDSAQMLADAAVHAIRRGDPVVVDFTELRAVSSSYFNILLLHVLSECGRAPFDQRTISFRFSSNAQRAIFDRSYAAVVGSPE